jgi:hypothetical protein
MVEKFREVIRRDRLRANFDRRMARESMRDLARERAL